jgi:Zn-dependent protease with chaperone function
MDLFYAQDVARRRAGSMFTLALCLMVGVMVAIHMLAVFLVSGTFSDSDVHRVVVVWTLPLSFLLLSFGVIVRVYALRMGGSGVAEELGGKRLHPASQDPAEQGLLQLVESLALSFGVPVPEVWVLPTELGINAFAAGNDTASAVIGVTKGALDRLTTDELRGVLLHEFSHILSGDMRLKFRMLVWVQGILFLSLAGRLLVASDSPVGTGFWGRNASASRKVRAGKLPGTADGESQSRSLLGVVLLILGSVTGVFGRFLQGTISRDLEFAADAAAGACLPSPSPVVSALRKIGGLPESSLLENPTAPESGHLFFAPASEGISSLFFPTHPTLVERIQRLQPDWGGDFLSSRPTDGAASTSTNSTEITVPQETAEPMSAAAKAAAAIGAKKREKLRSRELSLAATPQAYPVANLEYFGQCMQPAQLAMGPTLKRSLRNEWVAHTQTREGVHLLLLEMMKPNSGGGALDLGAATATQMVLLLDLSMPLLRRMKREEYVKLIRQCRREVVRPQDIDLLRYLLMHSARRRLGIALGLREAAPVVYEELPSVWGECQSLISMMTKTGSRSIAARNASRTAAWNSLGYEVPPNDRENVSIGQVVAALEACEQASGALRKRILVACGFAGAAQGFIMDREMAILRLMADSMGCSVPHLGARKLT